MLGDIIMNKSNQDQIKTSTATTQEKSYGQFKPFRTAITGGIRNSDTSPTGGSTNQQFEDGADDIFN